MTEDKIKPEFRQHGEHTWWCNWVYFWWAEHGCCQIIIGYAIASVTSMKNIETIKIKLDDISR